jgi:hypothetical protein
MKMFSDHLSEATETKNTHLVHLEDLIFDPDGANRAIQILQQLGEMLTTGTVSPTCSVSVKWDGAPAVVFGPDPVDGQFFVGTKSVFNVEPKLAKSHAEIDALYSPQVADILHVCFDRLQAIHPGLVLQGDVLFTTEMLSQEMYGCVAFRPNTLLYAVPLDSALGQQVVAASLGIALHTQYVGTGETLAEYSAMNLNPETFASLRHDPSVLLIDANYDTVSGGVRFQDFEEADFRLAMEAVLVERVPPDIYDRVSAQPFRSELERYFNYEVKRPSPGGLRLVMLQTFMQDRQAAAVAARKTLAGKQAARDRFDQTFEWQNPPARAGLLHWLKLHESLTRAKLTVIRTLARGVTVQAFVPMAEGEWRRTGPEGFVVALGSTTVKLVDRTEFSRLNFTLPRTF